MIPLSPFPNKVPDDEKNLVVEAIMFSYGDWRIKCPVTDFCACKGLSKVTKIVFEGTMLLACLRQVI